MNQLHELISLTPLVIIISDTSAKKLLRCNRQTVKIAKKRNPSISVIYPAGLDWTM